MSIYAIADPHLSLDVPKPMDIFGSRWENWTEKLCAEWNSTVGPEDTVVLPGDISWGMSLDEARSDLKLIDSLPGKKLLGKGNHDYWWSTASKINSFFTSEGIQSIQLLYNTSFLVENTVICGCRGWYTDEKNAPKDADYEKICAREAGRLKISLESAVKRFGSDKRILAFFHFPPVFMSFICRELLDVLHDFGVTECFYGHIHGKYNIPQTFVYEDISFTLISADYLGFKPFLISN